MEPIDQALFEGGGACERNLGEEAGVEAQRDGRDAGENRSAEGPPYPFAGAERNASSWRRRGPRSTEPVRAKSPRPPHRLPAIARSEHLPPGEPLRSGSSQAP